MMRQRTFRLSCGACLVSPGFNDEELLQRSDGFDEKDVEASVMSARSNVSRVGHCDVDVEAEVNMSLGAETDKALC